MKTSFEIIYPASIEKVITVLGDPDFLTARIEQQFPEESTEINYSGTVLPTEQGFVAVTDLTASGTALKLPPVAQKFIPAAGLQLQVRDEWDTSNYTGIIEVDTGGLPVSVKGFSRLIPLESETKRIVELEVKVSIPLFGKKIEQQVVDNLESVASFETQAFTKFIN
ncbi:DUF2505 domain-containing protein [Gleimia sp. 6138-11-ORH1]|uniref:DUF2505 domain-containing protein n=1 Tax=Gleimia sp. 6138-11-ORH1 TaxID=2973937 RepID=UPI00216A9EF7|nr:DUF2505 domain-containing protein [Gleimia sp. 6138-11-ORH1]MCS4485255.1 DUF2505 domain-containing protein [Gleimia sp. 6138-11-ORH1]